MGIWMNFVNHKLKIIKKFKNIFHDFKTIKFKFDKNFKPFKSFKAALTSLKQA